jgi:tetratricopeptide (TPR) repeat protein
MIRLALMAAFALSAQDVGSSALQGLVRDPQGRAVPSALVQLKAAGETFSATADFEGRYRFPALRPGPYSIQVKAGALEADTTLTLGESESKTFDIRLSAAPPFFDPPSFIVAGVTDSASRGGHGSDPILHSTESLAKAAAALGTAANQPDAQQDPLDAIRAAQTAAEKEPTESRLFDWGAELLTHRAAEQAADVFSRGKALFPKSTRMTLGLAVAYYSQASYADAQRCFFEAADLDANDPTPYLFLGQARNSPIGQSPGFIERMERFARLHPENAQANYYYALLVPEKAEALLTKAVRLDLQFADAWLQLGVLFADRGDLAQAIAAWKQAGAKAEAHYRLARAYRQTGDPAKAKTELELYERLTKQSAEDEERERARIQQFVFTLKDAHQ